MIVFNQMKPLNEFEIDFTITNSRTKNSELNNSGFKCIFLSDDLVNSYSLILLDYQVRFQGCSISKSSCMYLVSGIIFE